MFILRTGAPQIVSIVPRERVAVQESDTSKIDLKRIVEGDLFSTSIKKIEPKTELEEQKITVPEPPKPRVVPEDTRELIEMLPPLQVKLKGVISDSNPLYRRAIIVHASDKKEKLYKIGDQVEDARLIHLSKNKAIFIRSNGQQEVLFITEDDAAKDKIYRRARALGAIIKKIDSVTYEIDQKGFVSQVQSIAQILDALDITAVFDRGKSTGCRIGKMAAQSLGELLGFQAGDIVVTVNDIPTTAIRDRVKIYKQITGVDAGQRIRVALLRGGEPITITYVVKREKTGDDGSGKRTQPPAGTVVARVIKPKRPEKTGSTASPQESAAQKTLEVAEYNLAQASQSDALAQTMQKKDAKNMVDFGGRNALLQR
jgi:type II secretory pathway component PulC